MPNFNFLPNNKSNFPHIDNIDTYKYDNNFDYGRFDYDQMDLQICCVPWDMGEARIGQRTISGIGNVVYFETKAKRDKWFDDIPDNECIRISTKFKKLHSEKTIDVPIPFDVCARYNYLKVHYSKFANDNSPVQYETNDGLRDWFWFIREVEFIAPNNTRLHLLDDAFQTWIYDVDLGGMILERGHAPLFKTSVEKYLSNPLENSKDLLVDDVNYGTTEQVKHIDVLALNEKTTYACIATTSYPLSERWGTKQQNNWACPTRSYVNKGGVPSYFVFAIKTTDINKFLLNIDLQIPQFKQTLQAIFFVSDDLIKIEDEFIFADTSCYALSSSRKTFDFVDLNKDLFRYDSKYSKIAKLYTFPYAHIEVTDEKGNTDVIKIEETNGTIQASVALSLSYPYINIDSHLLGVGGTSKTTISYKNIDSKSFTISGKWYEYLRKWEVPTFAILQDASVHNDFDTHFDREQRRIDYETIYNNAIATANNTKTVSTNDENTRFDDKKDDINADKTVADRTATNTKTVSDRSALRLKDNSIASSVATKDAQHLSATTDVQNMQTKNLSNTSLIERSNQSAFYDTYLATELATASQAYNAGYTFETVNNEIVADRQIASNSIAGGMVTSIGQGAVSGAAAGGGYGALAGGALGLIQGTVNGVVTNLNTTISTNLKKTQADKAVELSEDQTVSVTQNNYDRTHNQTTVNYDNLQTNITSTSTVTYNQAATEKINATNINNTNISNSNNQYRTDTSNNTSNETTSKANAKTIYVNSNTINERDKENNIANINRTFTTQSDNAGRTKTQAQKAIENSIKQKALNAPLVFGNFENGENATTRPIALIANIITQSNTAISATGDEFLRYGYMYNRQWNFTTWNIGKYFTYWKIKDFWVKNLTVPDMYMDRLRFFFFGGVTIWRKPEDIGKVSIYENI